MILLEVMNQQMKILQSVVMMLYIQNPAELTNLAIFQVLIILNNPKIRELQNKVDKYIEEAKEPKALMTIQRQQSEKQPGHFSAFAQ